MNTSPLVVEKAYDASVASVWSALTDNDKMKKWYFQLPEFRAEVGFKFSFTGGSKEKQYLHLCRITEVIPNKKLAYTWKYDGYPGESLVTFELFEEGDRTRVKLTHAGLESFPSDTPDFASSSFQKGWESILGTSLKNFVENK